MTSTLLSGSISVSPGLLKKAHLRPILCDPYVGTCWGALGRTLNVQEVRLACGHRAPPRIWTFSSSPAAIRHSRGGYFAALICLATTSGYAEYQSVTLSNLPPFTCQIWTSPPPS